MSDSELPACRLFSAACQHFESFCDNLEAGSKKSSLHCILQGLVWQRQAIANCRAVVRTCTAHNNRAVRRAF